MTTARRTHPTLRLRGVTVDYGARRALDGVSIDFSSHAVHCILGPNGAGKSTLMRAIAGTTPVTTGAVTLLDRDVTNQPDAVIRSLSVAPQRAQVFAGLTPHETLSFAGTMRGLSGDELRDRIEHYLTVTQLHRERTTLARDLSGGMVRKLAVASALIGATAAVLLDESFAGLDPEAIRLVEDELRAAAERGTAVLLVTHRLDLVYRLADAVSMLVDGRGHARWSSQEFREAVDAYGGDPNELFLRTVREARRGAV